MSFFPNEVEDADQVNGPVCHKVFVYTDLMKGTSLSFIRRRQRIAVGSQISQLFTYVTVYPIFQSIHAITISIYNLFW